MNMKRFNWKAIFFAPPKLSGSGLTLGAAGQNKMCCNLCLFEGGIAALYILRNGGILSVHLFSTLC